MMMFRAYLNHLLRAVPARSALFEKQNAFFFTKTSKNTCHLGVKRSKCSKFAKARGKNPKLCPFTGLSCPFLVIPHVCPYFLE